MNKVCPVCGSGEFSICTDATLKFAVDEFGALNVLGVIDAGGGFRMYYVPWCRNGHSVEFGDMVAAHDFKITETAL